MCKDRELPLSGNKKTLIDRLDKHNEEQKKIIKEKEDKENKVILDSVKQKKHMLEVRVKKLAVLRKRKLDDLVEAQKTFDAIEAEVNEVKATLKSLDYLF